MRRYPVQPLLAITGLTLNGFIRTRMPSVNGTYYRKARDEGLTADQADRWAMAAGFHPYEVWPEMVDHTLEDTARVCEECAEPFQRGRSDQRFCSAECRWRKAKRDGYRRRYQTDPAFRERELQRVRDYQSDPKVAAVRRRKQRIRDRREEAA